MPPSARELIAQSQIERPELALMAEEHERHILDAPVQGTPISAGPDGVTVRTSNGGKLLVRNTAQNFNPTEGESYQLRLSPGQASLVANSIATPQPVQATENQLIVQTRKPTTDDGGAAGRRWLNLGVGVIEGDLSGEYWIYVPQLGRYAKVSGGSGDVAITYSDQEPPGGHSTSIANTDANISGRSIGDIWHNTVLNREFRLVAVDASNSKWVSTGSKNFTSTPPVAQADSLVEGDTIQLYKSSFFWTGSDWLQAHCCDDPQDPPSENQCTTGAPIWEPNCPDPQGASAPNDYTCECNSPI